MIVVNPILGPDDYASVLAIRRSVFVAEQGVPVALEVDEYEETSRFFLARDATGQPVGTGRFRTKGPFAKFERIATLKQARGSGVGRAVMRAMEAAAALELPRHLPYMHSQADAIAFYERLGWSGVGARFYEAGIEHLAMIKVPESAAVRAALICLEPGADVAPGILNSLR